MMRHMDANDNVHQRHHAAHSETGWATLTRRAHDAHLVNNSSHPHGRTPTGVLLDGGFADICRPQAAHFRIDPKFAAQDRKGPHAGSVAYGSRRVPAPRRARLLCTRGETMRLALSGWRSSVRTLRSRGRSSRTATTRRPRSQAPRATTSA